jgi:type IV secretory pathway component VirB8
MKTLKRAFRFFRVLLFAFMLAICMVLGIAPLLPKRKESYAVEIKIEETESNEDNHSTINLGSSDYR